MTDTENLPALPEKWCWTKLEEVGYLLRGVSYTKEDLSNMQTPNHLPVLRATNFQNGKVNLKGELVFVKKSRISDEQLIKIGDIIIAMSSGSALAVGKAAQLKTQWNGSFGAFCSIFRPVCEYINYYFIGLLFQTIEYRKNIERSAAGTNIRNLSKKHIQDFEIPLPPLPEQHRIVQKIEELFTDLDAGVKELEKAKVQVKNYRRAILKAAVEGKIIPTEAEISKKESFDFESANTLLDRILEERGLKKKSSISKISVAYKSESINSRVLPEGWCWATYEQIGDWVGGGTPKTTEEAFWQNGTIPWVSPKDMKSSKIYDTQDKITESAVENSAAKMIPAGSLLFVVRSGILRRTLPIGLTMVDCAVNQDLKALVPSKLLSQDFLLFSAQGLSEDIRNSCAKNGTTVESIEFSALKFYSFPLPPLAEQNRIVSEIERRFSVIDQIEKTIDQSLAQAEKLRQSILKKAFEGKLVPQDPNDEPASVLLERIKQEKGRVETRKKLEKKTKLKAKTIMEISGNTKQAELF